MLRCFNRFKVWEQTCGRSRQHDCRCAMFEQFSDVSRLDARVVVRAGFVPIPVARPAGNELGIIQTTAVVECDTPPLNGRNARRWRLRMHSVSIHLKEHADTVAAAEAQ